MERPAPPVLPNYREFGLSEQMLKAALNKSYSIVAACFVGLVVHWLLTWGPNCPPSRVILFLSLTASLALYLFARGREFEYRCKLVGVDAKEILACKERHDKYQKALVLYKKSMREFEAWLVRAKYDYWHNLNSLQFEREVGNL